MYYECFVLSLPLSPPLSLSQSLYVCVFAYTTVGQFTFFYPWATLVYDLLVVVFFYVQHSTAPLLLFLFLYLSILNMICKEIFSLILHRDNTKNIVFGFSFYFKTIFVVLVHFFAFRFFAGKLSTFTRCSPQSVKCKVQRKNENKNQNRKWQPPFAFSYLICIEWKTVNSINDTKHIARK